MNDKDSRQAVGWLMVFLYFSFLYTYGAKLSTLLYTDFPSFYYGARTTFVEKQSPYGKDVLQKAMDKAEPAKPNEIHRRVYPYLYPPPSLLMFYPFAKLHIGVAKAALLVVNHLCLLAIIGMLLIPIAGFKPRDLLTVFPAFFAIYLIYSKGTFNTIELGQINLIVLALLCLAWWGIKRDWPAWAIAIPLGIATIFKIYPILFLVLLAIHRRWTVAVMTVGVLGLICLAAWFTIPRPLWHQWAHDVAPSGSYLNTASGIVKPTIAENVGLSGFTARLFLPPQLSDEANYVNPGRALLPFPAVGRILTYASVALAVFTTMAVSFSQPRKAGDGVEHRRSLIDLHFAAFLILTFLVAPLAWEHHLVYVAPAVVIAILAVFREPGRNGCCGRGTMVLLIACIIGWPLSIGKLPLPRVVEILLVSLKFYAVVGLWGFLLMEMTRVKTAVRELVAV